MLIANRQVAVTVALWTGARAWLLGTTLYLPDEWLTSRQRVGSQIPAAVQFEPKWRLALTLLRQVRAAGLTVRTPRPSAGAIEQHYQELNDEIGLDQFERRTILDGNAMSYSSGGAGSLTRCQRS